jgi:hypothetical protein
MVWKQPGKQNVRRLVANAPYTFEFELLDRSASPAQDEALYMGMLGHAAFVKTDGSVFAHVHPNGSMAMAAYMMANPQSAMADMRGMKMTQAGLPAAVGFPYGFPSAGYYRIFVQMKHGETVETGVFDADVQEAVRH